MKDNISIIISIISLAISIFTLVYNLITNRKKVKLLVNHYTLMKINKDNFYDFDLIISNESRIPISINGMQIIYKKTEYEFIKSPRDIMITTDIKTNMKSKVRSELFPITINSSSSKHCFVSLYGPETFDSDYLEFNLKTNRGIIKNKIKLKDYYVTPENFADKVRNYID